MHAGSSTRNEQGYAVTVACPALLIVFYVVVLRLRKAERSGPSTAIFAVCGMWVLALSFTTLSQWIRSEAGIGFEWRELGYLLVYSFMPIRILEVMTLGGNIFALILGTLAMVNCHVIFERSRWIIPPFLLSAFHHAK